MGGNWGSTRQMTTYVNGKVCSTINKGVFQTPDGRFAVSTDGIFLFASTNESFIPGLRLKYFEFKPYTTSTEVMNASNAYLQSYRFMIYLYPSHIGAGG